MVYQVQMQAFDIEHLTNVIYRVYEGPFYRPNERVRIWHQAHLLLTDPTSTASSPNTYLTS
jgi:hypothetical protein